MTSVSFYPNTLYPYSFINTNYQSNPINSTNRDAVKTTFETFQDSLTLRSPKEIKMEKLNKLFPNGSLITTYYQMNKEFGIDKPAKLNLVDEKDCKVGGGYTFTKNEINMNLSDLIESDTKIIGIKNGVATTLVAPNEQLPLFVDKKSAQEFIKTQSLQGNMGYDQLIAVPVTANEQKKFILQKIAHEVIHSQQHMIMRNSENIGTKEIIKAWNNHTPENLIEKFYYGIKNYIDYKMSVWDKIEKEVEALDNEAMNETATTWLNAVKNYAEVDTQEYLKNDLETDANNRAAEYIQNKYGAWN